MAKVKLTGTPMVFTSEQEVHAGSERAKELGHTYDTRKFKVQFKGNTFYCLGYSPANAVSRCWEGLGIQVAELKAAAVLTKEDLLSRVKSLPPAELDHLMKELAKK